MRIAILLVAVLLISCTQQVEMHVENQMNETESVIVGEDTRVIPEFNETKPDRVSETRDMTVTLIEGEPQILDIMGKEYTLELVDVSDTVTINYHGVALSAAIGERMVGHDFTIKVISASQNSYVVPKKSWVDLMVSYGLAGSRENLNVGEGKVFTFGDQKYSIYIDFVGLTDGVPRARIIVNDQDYYMGEDDEEYIGDLYLRMRGIYFNDAVLYKDIATVKFTAR